MISSERISRRLPTAGGGGTSSGYLSVGRLAIGAGLVGLFALYLFSLYPTVAPYRDSGDMAASALTLGVAHPPGYPLYLLLAHLWLKILPWGNVALRLNALSAFAGVAACGVLALVLARPREGEEPSLAAPAAGFLLLGLSPAFWHLSLVSEMYSLNALVGAVLLLLMLPRGDDSVQGRRRLYFAAMLCGLGLGNHQTLVAAVPGLLWMARRDLFPSGRFFDRRFWSSRLPALIAFFALGLVLYLYLPLRSLAEPVIDWGDPETPRNFFRMLTRADLGAVRLHPDRPPGLSPAHWWPGLLLSGRVLAGELSWVGCALAFWGLWSGRRRAAVQGSFLAFFASGPLFIIWANLDVTRPETYGILEPHLVLPLVFAAALAGWGAADLYGRLPAASGGGPLPDNVRRRHSLAVWLGHTSSGYPSVGRLSAAILTVILALAWALLPGRSVALGSLTAYRGDFSAYDYGVGLHSSLPPASLIVDPDDPTAFSLSYLARAHGKRTDILPIMYFRTWWGYHQLKRRHPELLPPWDIQSGQELLGTIVSRSLEAKRPLFVDLPQKAPFGKTPYPAGLVYRLFGDSPQGDRRKLLFLKAERMRRFIRMRRAPEGDFFTRHTIAYWSSALNNLGIEAQSMGLPETAAGLYRRALAVSPDLPQAWNNLANTLIQTGKLEAAVGCYRNSIRIKPAPQVIYNLGRAYLMDARYADAERALRRAIEAGGPLEARNDLGLVFLRSGRIDEAVRQWEGLLREQPRFALAYYNLGLAYERRGEKRKAFAAVRLYAELIGNPAERREAFRWMERLKN